MRSKNNLTDLQSIRLAVEALERFVKKRFLMVVRHFHSSISTRLFNYTGRAHHRETVWLLQADRYVPDQRKVPLPEDQEVKAKSNHIQSTRRTTPVSRFTDRYSIKSGASSTNMKRSFIRGTSQFRIGEAERTLAPLPSSRANESSDSEQESQAISNFREQKSRREEFKNRLLQNQRREIFRIIDKTITNLVLNPGKKLKREKLQQIDHYINMEVSYREPEENQEEKLKRVPIEYKKKNSKTERTGKTNIVPAHLTRDKHEELKLEQKIYLLNVPHEIKLNSGVTLRENQRHGHSYDNMMGNANRKKLQFLKNEEINPVRIKMSELMSYKKITTMTNLAYCSSMKTVKDIPKEGTDSKISIDSKQFVQEPSGSKKLIKIANRRIYQQLLVDFSEEGIDPNFKKAKLKTKKEGKVRFDNVGIA